MYVKIYNLRVFFVRNVVRSVRLGLSGDKQQDLCKASIRLGCPMMASWAQFSVLKVVLSDI